MPETKAYKLRPGRPPVSYIPNEDEFFKNKAEKMKAFLEKHPVPEHIFKKQN